MRAMVGWFHGFSPSVEPVILLFFLVFLISAYIIFRVVARALIFMLLGAMFPIFLKYVLHMDIALNIHTIAYYAILAGILYLIYLLFRTIATMVKAGMFTLKLVLLPFRIITSIIRLLLRAVSGKGREKRHMKEKKAGEDE